MIGAVLRIRYELTQELGESEIFHIYRARDRVGGRDVTLRVLKPPFTAEHDFVARLRTVVDESRAVQHPSIERLLETDEDEGFVFVVSEFAMGQNLAERIKRLAPFSAPVAIQCAIGLCEALEAVHSHGIVHGDVAARNVTQAADGSVKLALAGIWRSYSASRLAGIAMTPAMAPALAPEISAGEMPTPASDIYALGVLLFELLAGRPPFTGDTPVAIGIKHATSPVPSVRMFNPSAPTVLDEAIKKALAKAPADRYQTAADLLADLRAIGDALRFGRQLQWPITKSPKPAEPAMVAPKMSAVRPEPKAKSRALEPDPEAYQEPSDGVPKWLSALVYLAMGALVCMVLAFLFFNFNRPSVVKVPDVMGLTAREAAQRLADLGLELRVSARRPSETAAEGTIIDLDPRPGRDAREGSTVGAVVSSGSKFVQLPDLRGRTLEDARSLLASLNLQVDDPPREVRNREVEAGKIINQVPEPRRKVERFSRIRLEVSAGPRGPRDVEQNLPLSVYALTVKMPASLAEEVLVRIDLTDARGTRTVYEQRHRARDRFEIEEVGEGEDAMFRVFFDGQMVRQVTQRAATE